jgi:hypothetical protein
LQEALAEAHQVNKAAPIQAEQVLQVKVLLAVIIFHLQITVAAVAAVRVLLGVLELRLLAEQVVLVFNLRTQVLLFIMQVAAVVDIPIAVLQQVQVEMAVVAQVVLLQQTALLAV